MSCVTPSVIASLATAVTDANTSAIATEVVILMLYEFSLYQQL